MIEYRIISGKKGDRYLKNGRFVKRDLVPVEILAKLPELGSVEIHPPKEEKTCIFCGQFAKYSRFVNLKAISLCEEHYYSMSLGKVVHKARELA